MKSLFALCVFLILQGCVVAHEAPSRKGPPDHAPAHGYRAKYRYHYYPEVNVYFDLDRSIYFYWDSSWHSARVLPHGFSLSGRAVFLELDQDRPYKYHKEHRRKYYQESGKDKKYREHDRDYSRPYGKEKKYKNKHKNKHKWK